jgi:hypothetical protein
MDKSKMIEELTVLEAEKRKLLDEIARINHEEWVKDEPIRKERELKRKRERRQKLKERKAREKAEEAKRKAEEERKALLKVKIQEQKIVVDKLIEEATKAQELWMDKRSARQKVIKQQIAEATAELREQLAALEAATWDRLAQEPESMELNRLEEIYGCKTRIAAQAMYDMRAACEFHPKESRDPVRLECRCFYLASQNCRICGTQYKTIEGECHCFHN